MTDETITGSSNGSRVLCGTFLVCSALTCVVIFAFFLIGLNDGSVSSFNIGLWLSLLTIAGLSLWSGYALRAKGKIRLATTALAVTAVPGLIAALFLLLVVIAQPRWN